MSGKTIKFEISENEIQNLKDEIRDYIKDEVSIVIREQLFEKETSEKMKELEEMVHDTFRKGTDLKDPSRNRSTSPTTQTKEDLDVKEVCKQMLEGVWVQEIQVKCLEEGPEFHEEHKILQKGVLLDWCSGWKFDFCMFKKSEKVKLEKNKSYTIGPVVSSVYDGKTEIHLNSKTEILEAQEVMK
tara:strand:+ start:1794 stop:2348 length:555 start_codon:yes stop_codon:yes gene_type:complete